MILENKEIMPSRAIVKKPWRLEIKREKPRAEKPQPKTKLQGWGSSRPLGLFYTRPSGYPRGTSNPTCLTGT